MWFCLGKKRFLINVQDQLLICDLLRIEFPNADDEYARMFVS